MAGKDSLGMEKMGTCQRAYLFLVRNKRKTAILLAILTAVAALMLLCLSVGSAAGAALRELRRQMGGYFKIETDAASGKFGRIDDALVEKVVDAGGIRAVNGTDTQYFITKDLTLSPGRFSAEGDVKAKLARFLGNTDSSLSEYFMLRYYSLADGRHIAPDDEGKAVISEGLARQNHLSIGDVFTVRYYEENLPEEMRGRVASHTLEIVGIYRIDMPQSNAGADSAECDIDENFIFTDTAFIREVCGEAAGARLDMYTGGVSFFVEDPKELNGILERLLKSEDYDWNQYSVEKNNKTYEDSAAPLERLSGLVSMMILVIAVVSAAMLSLILFLWMRERMHEVGIYLSIGIRKTEIVRQRILENLAVAAAAFLLAWGIVAAVSGLAGRAVTESFVKVDETEISRAPSEKEIEETSELDMKVGAAQLAGVAGLEVLLVLLSTGISSVAVLRMQPKSILSRMS